MSFNNHFPHYHPDILERTYLNSHGEFSVQSDIQFEEHLRKTNRDQCYEFERSKHKPARCK